MKRTTFPPKPKRNEKNHGVRVTSNLPQMGKEPSAASEIWSSSKTSPFRDIEPRITALDKEQMMNGKKSVGVPKVHIIIQ